MKKSSKVILIIVLILIVMAIGVGGYFVGLKIKESNEKINELENKIANTEQKEQNNNLVQNKIEENTTNNGSSKKNSEISGLYRMYKNFGNDNILSYYLFLYENGEFKYEHSTYAAQGEIGTYEVSGNTITLNVKYLTGSDIGLTKTNQTIKLTINEDGSISDKNNFFTISEFQDLDEKYKDYDFGNIIMKKESKSEEDIFLKECPSIQNIIDNAAAQNAIN